jgi:hypothetical protein
MQDLWRLFDCVATIRPFTFREGRPEEHVAISVTPDYTVLTVGRRQFYFIRETGAFDGVSVTF